jgi:hypothetical protein
MQVGRGFEQLACLLDGVRKPYDRLGDHIRWDGRVLRGRFGHRCAESLVSCGPRLGRGVPGVSVRECQGGGRQEQRPLFGREPEPPAEAGVGLALDPFQVSGSYSLDDLSQLDGCLRRRS